MTKKKSSDVGFCRYIKPIVTPSGERRFDHLFSNEERRTISLAPEGIPWITGVGHSHYRQSHPSLDLHVHLKTIEIHICLTGFLRFEIDGKIVDVHPGEVCLTQPYNRHRLIENNKGHSHFWMLVKLPETDSKFTGTGLDEKEFLILFKALKNIRRRVFTASTTTLQHFKSLFTDLDSQDLGKLRRLTLRTDVLSILLSMINDAHRNILSFVPDSVRDAVRQINLTSSDIPTLEQLTLETGLNRNKLTYGFKQLTGLPPKAYALTVRIDQAKELLTTSQKSIATISDQLGFSSPSHFTSQFRQHTGQTPSSYRSERAGNCIFNT